MKRLGDKFVLEREIGAGGMSVIFLGKDEILDRPVAVKILRSDFGDPEFDARFRREGRTAAGLSHPNIVQVYDAGEDELDGREVSYIVMEYVPGGDLKTLIDEKGPLSEKELARIGADVASGLAHAHRRGIVHRDIKPQNILIDDYGRPKLADFGIARALGATQATRTGSYLGTASYSSPEQLRGGEITTKSDIYSLGCTLYEAAVGEPPFSGSPIEVAGQQLTKPPAPPRERGVSLSKPLETLILSCLAKEPVDRPDAAGLQERLLRASAVASGAVATAPALGETTRSLAEAVQEVGVVGPTGVTRGLGAAVRGLRDRVSPTGTSERTLISPPQTPHRTFRQGRDRRVALAAGVLALVLLGLVVATAPMFLGANTGKEAEQAADQQDTVEPTAAPVASEPAPPPDAAANAVYNMYVQESYQTPDTSWAYLSQRLKDEVGSPERWAEREQIYTLWYVYFTQVPKAEVSGDKAEVGFQVKETRTGGARLVSGTWECVNEDGQWKLDRLTNEKIQNL